MAYYNPYEDGSGYKDEDPYKDIDFESKWGRMFLCVNDAKEGERFSNWDNEEIDLYKLYDFWDEFDAIVNEVIKEYWEKNCCQAFYFYNGTNFETNRSVSFDAPYLSFDAISNYFCIFTYMGRDCDYDEYDRYLAIGFEDESYYKELSTRLSKLFSKFGFNITISEIRFEYNK